MKIFAALLLLMNVGYLAWMQFHEKSPSSAVATAPARQAQFAEANEKLLLVSERPAEPRAVPVAQPPALLENNPQEEIPAPSAVELAVETAEQVPEAGSLDAPEEALVPAVEVMPWCVVVGGFESSEAATAFLSGVTALGGAGELNSTEERVSSTWWVHLPAFPSEAAARPTLTELQSKNIDNFYIKTGQLAGAVSLGVFSTSASAAVAQRELAAKGYSTSISEVFRMATRFNVTVRLEDSALQNEAGWMNLIASLPAERLQEIACK